MHDYQFRTINRILEIPFSLDIVSYVLDKAVKMLW